MMKQKTGLRGKSSEKIVRRLVRNILHSLKSWQSRKPNCTLRPMPPLRTDRVQPSRERCGHH